MIINLNGCKDMNYDMTRLKNKICDIFKFNLEVIISLACIDEYDGIIALDNDDEFV